jgi:hypothetical protein
VQALLLFQSNNFLSSDPSTRAVAAINHTSLVGLARKAGLFSRDAIHTRRIVTYTGEEVLRSTLFEAGDLSFSYSFLPTYLPSCSDEEKIWRRWSELAGRRRTVHLIFVMDTVAHLDAGIAVQVKLDDFAHLPLPTPDTIWRAPSEESWKSALSNYIGPTLDEALTELLRPVNKASAEEEESNGRDRPPYKADIFGRHGPFARLVMVMALLRGVLHLSEERKTKVSQPSPLRTWLPSSRENGTVVDELELYKVALSRWRDAWDQDDLCLAASGPAVRAKAAKYDGDMSWLGSHYLFASQTASGAVPLSDDALPFYWLAYVLLGHASAASTTAPTATSSSEGENGRRPSPTQLMKKIGRMADSYSKKDDRGDSKLTPTGGKVAAENGGEERKPDYRSMLRFAKAFVSNGEESKE